MEITATMVKELRATTGAGMMDCKKALAESNGNMNQAVDILRTKGLADLAKKAGRATNEGIIGSFIGDDRRVGTILEVNCETDFVARNSDFKSFVTSVAKHVVTAAPADVTTLLGQPYVERTDITVEQYLGENVAKIGENMVIPRFARFELGSDAGAVGAYIHGVGNIGVLVEVAAGTAEAAAASEFGTFVKDVAMQIAAAAPIALSAEDMPADVIAHEKTIYMAQAAETGKPESIQTKIAEGRLQKFFKEVSLVEQTFVKDPDITIAQLTERVGVSLGTDVSITRFARFVLGETNSERKPPACG
ncbi:MAG: translation elongation factor Ts [Coriobacteriia bacterium]|nr:translation elongation factor Ts [Coriobacteriia bacterium]